MAKLQMSLSAIANLRNKKLTHNFKRPSSPPWNKGDPVIVFDDDAAIVLRHSHFYMCIFTEQTRPP